MSNQKFLNKAFLQLF